MMHNVQDERFRNINVLCPVNQSIDNTLIYKDDEAQIQTYLYDNCVVSGNSDLHPCDANVDWRPSECDIQRFGDESFNKNYSYKFSDACDGHGNADGLATADYWEENINDPDEYRNQYRLTAKMLPAIPGTHDGDVTCPLTRHESSVTQDINEATYARSLPAAPASNAIMVSGNSSSICRMLPMTSEYQNNHNGYYDLNQHTGYVPNVGLADERMSSFISLPTAPIRMLPQPHLCSSQQLVEGRNHLVLDSSENHNKALFHNSNSGSTTSQTTRPHSSMLPIDYSDFSYNLDNLSTYSDIPPINNTPHKLQQHRKISLMMAMTTASVIASGETRLPVQQSQKDPINTSVLACTESFSATPAITNATATASEMWSKLEYTNSIDSTQTKMTTTTTRKLPKCLPSPLCNSESTVFIAPTAISDILSKRTFTEISMDKPQSEKNQRTKQLPKLPMPKNANTLPLISHEVDIAQQASIASLTNTVGPSFMTTSIAKITGADGSKNLSILEEQTFPRNSSGSQYYSCRDYIPGSIDSFKSWSASTVQNSPPLDDHDFQRDTIPILIPTSPKLLVESHLELESSMPVSSDVLSTTATACAKQKLEQSSFHIPAYLRPYTLNSINLTEQNQTGYIPITTTSTTNFSYENMRDDILDTLIFSPSSLDNHIPYSITTWTSSPITNETAISEEASVLESEKLLAQSSDCSYKLPSALNRPMSPSILSQDKNRAPDMSHLQNVFTTTVISSCASSIDLNSSSPAKSQTSAAITTDSSITMLSYVDYMKKFELPELPPAFDNSSSNNTPTVITSTDISYTDNIIASLISKDTSISSDTLECKLQEKLCDEPKKSIYEFNQIDYNVSLTAPKIDFSTPSDIKTFNNECSPEAESNTIISTQLKITLPDCSFLGSDNGKPVEFTATAFDDSFYNSFNVDLSALTAAIDHSESEPRLVLDSKFNNDPIFDVVSNTLTDIAPLSQITESSLELISESCVGSSLDKDELNKMHSLNIRDLPPLTHEKSKATSVLGGISKGIKGGLDGVLSGVSLTMDAPKQHPVNNKSKNSFGFELASKFVPSVDDLLSSSNKHAQQETVESTSILSNIIDNSMTTAIGYGYTYEYEQDLMNTNSNLTVTPTIEHLGSPSIIHNDGIPLVSSANSIISEEIYCLDNRVGPHTALEFENEYINIQYSGDEHDDIHSYPNKVIESNYKKNGLNITSDKVTCSPSPYTNKMQSNVLKESLKKNISSSTTSTSGMLGSIFGKAAAAVQSATQAVNQGASSVASAVAQKTAVTSSTTVVPGKPNNLPSLNKLTLLDSNLKSISNNGDKRPLAGTIAYHTIDGDYNELRTTKESIFSNQYLSTNEDDVNSNTQTTGYNDNEAHFMYYSDDIQRRLNTTKDTERHSEMLTLVTDEPTMISSVPAAGSTGKKLPIINGKPGLLIKQQPTEIFEDDSDDVVPPEPSYCIDSDQNDFYMHQHGTTPINKRLNAFYTHSASGYGFQEDFFNEEDEYKYLEQQNQQQYERQHEISLGQRQPSLDYLDSQPDDDDFLDENYQSDEDCGNYLDESSSGSVGLVEARKQQMETALSLTNAISNSLTNSSIPHNEHMGSGSNPNLNILTSYQETNKPHNIFIEGNLILDVLNDDSRIAAQMSPDRDESENDQLADLPIKRTKSHRKVLIRGETEEVVSGHMKILRKPEITVKQRWHWAFNKIIIQLNVSTLIYILT